MFPVIELKGEPFARGMAYGRAAHHQIAGSIRCYAALFASCGIDWKEAQRRAAEFRELIDGCGGGIIEEIEGIAAGSGFREDEILALNCRTEILPPTFLGMSDNDNGAARERNALMGLFDLGECTSVAISALPGPSFWRTATVSNCSRCCGISSRPERSVSPARSAGRSWRYSQRASYQVGGDTSKVTQ